MLFALGAVLLAIGVIITVASPFGGLLVYWIWFLVRPQETWLGLGGPIPMERIFAITLIISVLYHYRVASFRPFEISAPMKAFAILVIVNYLTVVTAVWRGNSLDTVDKFAKLFIVLFLATIILDTPKKFRIFLWVYALCLGWEAASTIHNYYANPYFAQGIQRAEGLTETWGDPNAEALNLVLTIPVLLAIRNASKKWKPTLVVLAILAAIFGGIVLTGSRTGFMILIIAFLLMTIRSPKRFVLLPGLFLLAFLVWILTPAQYKERYKTILSFAQDPTGHLDTSEGQSAYGRIVGFRVGMMMFADHPILGVGVGNFPFAWRFGNYVYAGQKGWHQPHNLPGQVLSEQGLAGGLSFIYFIVVIIRSNAAAARSLLKMRAPPAILLTAGKAVPVVITCLLLQGFSSHCYYRYNWYLMCTIVSVICVLTEKEALKAAEPESPSPSNDPRVTGARPQVSGLYQDRELDPVSTGTLRPIRKT